MKILRSFARVLPPAGIVLLLLIFSFLQGSQTTLAASYPSVAQSAFGGASTELSNGDVSLHVPDGDVTEQTTCQLACAAHSYAECNVEATVLNANTECGGNPCEESTCTAVSASAANTFVAPYGIQKNHDTSGAAYTHYYAIYEPISVTLSASPTSISSGGSATLSWTSKDAQSCTINSVAATPAASGSKSTGALTTTTTYTITCLGGGTGSQTATASATVTVNAATLPAATISVSPSTITSGDSTTVNWACTNSTFARITNNNNPNIGNISPYPAKGSGTVTDSPTQSGTYTLQCTDGSGNSDTDTANITVSSAAPTGTCSVSPTTATTGDTVTWSSVPSGGNGTYTYSWSGTDGLSGTTKNVNTSYSAAGTKSASVIITSGGKSTTVNCSNTVTVSPPALPDLTADTAVASPSPTTIGLTEALSANVSNIGNATALNFPNTFEMQDPTGAYSWVTANTISSEGQGVSKPISATSPAFNQIGTYQVRACANTTTTGTNSITESNYGNNCGSWTSVAVRAPNLSAGVISPTAFVAGQTSIISATITNSGTTGSGAFTNRFQRATDSSGTGQQALGTDAMGNIGAGGTGTTQVSITFTSADALASPFYIRVCADSNNDVTESNETDNCGPWAKVTVLDGSCSVSPTSANIGDTVTWSATPVGGAGGYTYSWGGTDGLTGSTRNVSTTYSTTGSKSANVTITSGAVSDYIACTNSVSIGVAPAPDLTAGAVTPTTATLNASTPFSATISNIGNATTGPLASNFRNTLQVATDNQGSNSSNVGIYTTSGPLAAGGTLTATVNYTPTSVSPFWARFCADSINQVNNESNENNNCGPWTRVDVLAPDFTAGDTTAGTAVVNQATSLSSSISNIGGAGGTNVPNVFQVKNPNDYTATNVIATIGAGVLNKSITGSYTFPTAQNYQVRACANMDTDGTIDSGNSESNTTNNCGSWLTISVGAAPMPDLTAGVPAVSPSSPSIGDTVTLTSNITNIGNATTGSGFTNLFEIDNNATHGTLSQVYALKTDNTATLGAGGNENTKTTFQIPSAGTWYVQTCADEDSSGSGTIAESNTTNNCSGWTSFTVGAPDLTAGAISPTTASMGALVTLTGTVTNGGGASTGTGFTNLFQRATDSNGGNSVDIGTAAMGTLNANGDNANSTYSYTFASSGTWYVRLCADKSSANDANGSITELNENNNCGSWTQVTVAPPAPPTCSLSSPTNPASPNQTVTVSWTSTNATSCTEVSNPDGFTTGGATSGSDTSVIPPSLPRSYGATCTGPGGTSSCTAVTITNICGSNANLSITATPNRVKQGGSSVISWTGTGIQDPSCTISGPGIGTITSNTTSCNLTPTPDHRTATNITKQSTYTLSCPSAAPVTATVNVIPKLIEF